MSRSASCAFALMLVVAVPLAASAQQRPGGGSRPAPQAPRPAPAVRAAPPSRPAPPSGGFNFNHDVNGQPGQPRYVAPRPNAPSTGYRPPAYGSGSTGGPHQGRFAGPVIRNGRAPGGTWGWNHGVAWLPAPVYWGGGFWGPWALAGLAGAELYGSIADSQAQIIYPSYAAEPDSPGAELLQDYGLQQTPCGPPDLVVIWGPDNSVICAYPNDTVAPGNYEVDPSTFTLVSASQ